jgi:hypothetical protein
VVKRSKRARVIAILQELRAKYGDVCLSEAEAREKDPRSGRPSKRDHWGFYEVYMCVEAIKASGMGTTAAWAAAAKFHKSNPNKIRKAYVEGRKRFGPVLKTYDSETVSKILNDHQGSRPRLKKLLAGLSR